MNERRIKNMSASVRARLTELAKSSGRPFQETLQYFAMERFLYRLAASPHGTRFVLKGALMFHIWGTAAARSTKDIDLLGRTNNSPENLLAIAREVCTQEVEPDGLTFDPATLRAAVIREDADYEGVRLTLIGFLQNAKIAMQIDIGFGDLIYPEPSLQEYPTLLDFPAPRLRGYRRETVVAEKFEAMVHLGLLNSRMKDFYDIWILSRQFDFEAQELIGAIERHSPIAVRALLRIQPALLPRLRAIKASLSNGKPSCGSLA